MGFPIAAARPVILFDLDGTLLPMQMKDFEEAYFHGLCRTFSEYPPEDLIRWVWAGTKAMVLNDGSRTNREAFAEVFTRESGVDYYENEERFLDYYRTVFQQCRNVCPITDISRQIVETLRQKGYTVAIATNPIFPKIATWSRLQWLGLDPATFPLVTTFDNSVHAKPNLEYYWDVCRTLGAEPADCIMIGNDVLEDGCAAKLGMEVFLVKDHLLNTKNLPTNSFSMGTLQDVLDWSKALPDC